MNQIYLAADKINGIFKVDPIDFPYMFLMNPKDFLSASNSLVDGELVFTVIDPDLSKWACDRSVTTKIDVCELDKALLNKLTDTA